MLANFSARCTDGRAYLQYHERIQRGDRGSNPTPLENHKWLYPYIRPSSSVKLLLRNIVRSPLKEFSGSVHEYTTNSYADFHTVQKGTILNISSHFAVRAYVSEDLKRCAIFVSLTS